MAFTSADRLRVDTRNGADVFTPDLATCQGESFGFSPDDLDRHRRQVHVCRQVKLVGLRLVFAPPTYGKERDVPLSDAVDERIADHLAPVPGPHRHPPVDRPRRRRDPHRAPRRPTRESRAINRTYFNARLWKPALVRAGVEPIRVNGTHALRHFFASVLLDAGENIKALAEHLGHADPGFTLRVHTHLMKASAARTRKAVDAVFDGGSTGEGAQS